MMRKRTTVRHRTRLRMYRAGVPISQMDLARKLGISTYRCWALENGYLEPTPKEREALAKFFKVAADDVFPTSQHERATA